MPVRLTAGTSPTTAPSRWAVVSTYQPTRCGIATFARSLVGALSDLGTDVDVVRIVDVTEPRSAPPVAYELVRGDLDSVDTAAQVLNGYDVAVIQHEYGIYGGQDGADLLALLSRLTVPVLTVLHTVLSEPTAHQRHVLQSVVSASDAVVTMTQTARRRLLDTVVVDPEHVQVIPHGAAQDLVSHAGIDDRAEADSSPGRPVVLTWGLLGRGKGIEWGIEAMAGLQDLTPRPLYVVAGRTHPRVLEHEGEAYREGLRDRVAALGMAADVVFDNGFLDEERLHRLVAASDVVLLPYDSREQVTSGVLIEAVAAARPVVSTRFPHAVELLDSGSGLLVDHGDPNAIAAALRRVLTEPGLAPAMSAHSRRIAPSLSWGSVAVRYLAIGRDLTAGRRTRTRTVLAGAQPAAWAAMA